MRVVVFVYHVEIVILEIPRRAVPGGGCAIEDLVVTHHDVGAGIGIDGAGLYVISLEIPVDSIVFHYAVSNITHLYGTLPD